MGNKPSIAVVEGPARLAIIDEASAEWVTDELQIDEDARVIDNESDGYWVQAWVFVRYAHEDGEPK